MGLSQAISPALGEQPPQPPHEETKKKLVTRICEIYLSDSVQLGPIRLRKSQISKADLGLTSQFSKNNFHPPACPGFTVDGSVQGSWNDTEPGETVTINCQKKHVQAGISERTCNADGTWNNEAPICMKLVWSPVVRDDKDIPFDLESTPLQIKTNSTAWSEEEIVVYTYTANGSLMGSVEVRFTKPIQYYISYCATSWPELPVQPGDEVDKIWTIRKTNTTLNIECNGVEVLNYQFSNSSRDKCVPKWGGDVVKKIRFHSYYDTASDSYRAKPTACPGFTVDGSVQGSWNDTEIGQTVTINCQKKHVLDGSSERTCNAEGEWNIEDAPLCRKLSE
eukprot:sb/3466540/